MDQSFKNDLIPVCKLLNEHGVEYLLIGGFAVNHHGYTRATGDVDIWYRPSAETFHKITKALSAFGIDVSDLEATVFDPAKSIVRLPLDKFHLDMLPTIMGEIKFVDAYRLAEDEMLGGVTIKVISYDHLVKNKLSTARPIDLIDVEELKKRQKGRNS